MDKKTKGLIKELFQASLDLSVEATHNKEVIFDQAYMHELAKLLRIAANALSDYRERDAVAIRILRKRQLDNKDKDK